MSPKLLNNVLDVFNKSKNTLNPSLYLDKYTGYLEQSEVKSVLKKVTELRNFANFIDLNKRFEILKSLPGSDIKEFECLTPFTIHLSRTTVLENTGICFHPIYGFVYIPGSGIKGLARAYARDILKSDEELITEIFGNDNEEKDNDKLKAGKVVFHDAFPVLDNTYQLNVEINNCHHMKYYDGKLDGIWEKGDTGDWEDPNPTYFLSVKPGAKFKFALSIRQDLKNTLSEAEKKELIGKAWEFIIGGIAHLGLGAKTAAGFGTMATKDEKGKYINPDLSNKNIKKFKTTLKFTTPAFLAGALLAHKPSIRTDNAGLVLTYQQDDEDCKITANNLRGQLRWWWRAIYSNYLDYSKLLTLEKLIWGSTENSSPVRIEISKQNNNQLNQINFETQEMKYISYGISSKNSILDKKRRIKKDLDKDIKDDYEEIINQNKGRQNIDKASYIIKRKSINKETTFSVTFYFLKDKVYLNNNEINIQEQVLFSIYLLTNYGGLGAKSRKGFGSVICVNDNGQKETLKIGNDEINIEYIQNKAKELINEVFNININANWNLITPIPITFNSQDPLQDLVKIYLCFTQSKAHKQEKGYLGLPHKYDSPPKDIGICNRLNGYIRYASPIIFHLEPTNQPNSWKLNITMIPKDFLNFNNPDCKSFLNEFKEYIENNINKPPTPKNYNKKGNNNIRRNNFRR